MKKVNLISALVIIFFNFHCPAQDIYRNDNVFTIVSYNVENLYDTIDDPKSNDNEFLPASKNRWNTEKYQKKIKNIALVLKSVNKNELPELIGLIEVENKQVLNDLVNQKFLTSGNYSIVHEDSPDERGIDVAILYRKNEIEYLQHEAIKIKYDFEPRTTTRDILYFKGKLKNNEMLHVFLNHWKSRREGTEITEPKRIFSARVLMQKVEEIIQKDPDAKIVIMGDFNDEPKNKSLNEVVNAGFEKTKGHNFKLINLMFDKFLFGQGTNYYNGKWYMIDNLIVSGSLINSPGNFEVNMDGGQIFKPDWLLIENVKTGDYIPKRTFSNQKYIAGFSDHLPVYLVLRK
ncbi:MAG: endonuclease [Bacteroidales bacterium]